MQRGCRRAAMSFSSSPLLLLVLLSSIVTSALALVSLNTTLCDGSNSTIPSGVLNQIISCLVSQAIAGGNRSCGDEINRVYGFAQCRGDLAAGDCRICVEDAGRKVLDECSGRAEGRGYGDKCVLFYQRRPFVFDGEHSPVKGPECGGEGVGNLSGHSAAIGELLDELGDKVRRTNGSFATGAAGEVFALAQCWALVGKPCGDCLGSARDALEGICSGSIEGGMEFDSCMLRYQNYPFGEAPTSPSQPSSPPASPSSEMPRSSRRRDEAMLFFIGGVVLLALCLILIVAFWKFVKRPAKLKNTRSSPDKSKEVPAADLFSGSMRSINYFDYQTLKKATKNFHPRNQLGRGGFGPVYQGKLPDGRLIAVKKLAVERSRQGEAEFLAEVKMITSIQHKNLLRLHGCCSDGEQRLLVYEYMKHRSLDTIIFGNGDFFLNWKTRFKIIAGIARGLQYLHEDSHLRIVHRDIKASNILLDEQFQPKIGDFGLARFFPEDQAYLSTTFAGTLGYTAPEYAIRGELSEKADIYSFGVLVLEIVCSRKNTDRTLLSEMQYLPEYAWKLYERLEVLDLLDPNIKEDGYVESDVLNAIHVALLCLQPYPGMRPAMSEVVAMLTCKVESMPTPVKPAFLDRRRQNDENVSWEQESGGFPSAALTASPSVLQSEKSPTP